MGYFKRKKSDDFTISEPIDIKVLLIHSFLTYTMISIIIFVIIIISNNISFSKSLSYFVLLYFLLLIPSCLLFMVTYYGQYILLFRKDYHLEKGLIDIIFNPYSKYRMTIYIDDIKSVKYVENIPPILFLRRSNWKYYKQYYFPSYSERIYLVELVDNPKIIYENRIYRLDQFDGNIKLVSNKFSVIPKIVIDEYKKRGFYFPKDH